MYYNTVLQYSTNKALGTLNLDKFTFDPSLTYIKGIKSKKVRLESKVSFMAPEPELENSKFYVLD